MLRAPLDTNAYLKLTLQHHAPAFAEHIERDRVHYEKWLPWSQNIVDAASARTFIERFLARLAAADGIMLGIWVDDHMAGGILLRTIDWTAKRTEIGYWIGESYSGRGLVTRAVHRMMDYAFFELGLNHMTLQAASTNVSSCAIAERLNFQLEGTLRAASVCAGKTHDHSVYGMLASEWSQHNSSTKFSDFAEELKTASI